MKIRGRVVSKETPLADATIQLWLVKRSDGTEIDVANGIKTDDSGNFEITQSLIDGVPYNSQYFKQVKCSVERTLYQTVQVSRSLDNNNDEKEINLGDIDLAWKALRVYGQITSNARPVEGATVIVQIDNVERTRIQTDHEGKFTRDIEGDYEGHRLVWTARRFGYVSATGLIPEKRSIEADLKPQWWTSRVVLGALPFLVLGLAVVFYIYMHIPDRLESEFQAQVVDFCQTHIANHSPLKPGGEELSLADVTSFFHPENGKFWKFFNINKNDLNEEQFRKKHARVVQISEGLFPLPHGEEPRISLKFIPRGNQESVKSVTLQVDGTGKAYMNQSPSTATLEVTWPSPATNPKASLEVKLEDGNHRTIEYPGAWGLIRLLQAGQMEEGVVHWTLQNSGAPALQVTFDVEAFGLPQGLAPLLSGLGENFECPTSL